MYAEGRTFLTKVFNLSGAEKSALKRSVGVPLHEARTRAQIAFYRCLPRDTPRNQEGKWFAIACFRCLWDTEASETNPFEKVVSNMLVTDELSNNMYNRLEAILNADWEDEGYLLDRLSHMIQLIRQKGSSVLTIDLSNLLSDLLNWNSVYQTVQRRWAREIFAPDTDEEAEFED